MAHDIPSHDDPQRTRAEDDDARSRLELMVDLRPAGPMCRHCDSPLIGSELAHSTCGDCGGRAVDVRVDRGSIR
jgi:Zn finger protein HypA/HybF involved in hydrogenase expression